LSTQLFCAAAYQTRAYRIQVIIFEGQEGGLNVLQLNRRRIVQIV
jgi:hypothetical protein